MQLKRKLAANTVTKASEVGPVLSVFHTPDAQAEHCIIFNHFLNYPSLHPYVNHSIFHKHAFTQSGKLCRIVCLKVPTSDNTKDCNKGKLIYEVPEYDE